jgi:hypothetical protein
MILKLISKFNAWRMSRYWRKRQFHELRVRLLEEDRWLASIPIAAALVERHLRFARPDWYTLNNEDIVDFRERIQKMPGGTKGYLAIMLAHSDGAGGELEQTLHLYGTDEDLTRLTRRLEYLHSLEEKERSKHVRSDYEAGRIASFHLWRTSITDLEGFHPARSLTIAGNKPIQPLKSLDADMAKLFPQVQFPLPYTPGVVVGSKVWRDADARF